MSTLILPVLHQASDPNTFVVFWSALYDYGGSESVYYDVIAKAALTDKDIIRMYQWKNNMGENGEAMSEKKQDYVARIIEKLDTVNQLKKNFDLEQYKAAFKELSAVWGTFLLHLIAPDQYPIYDQHVHRAFRFITGRGLEEIPTWNNTKYRVYYKEYQPFYNDFYLRTEGFRRKELDNALWTFGKFLSRYPAFYKSVLNLTTNQELLSNALLQNQSLQKG